MQSRQLHMLVRKVRTPPSSVLDNVEAVLMKVPTESATETTPPLLCSSGKGEMVR